MATAVRISGKLVGEAKRFGRIDHRSLAGQIEHWARMGKCAEENPDLPYILIKEILIGLDELDENEKTEYKFGESVMRIYQSRSFEKNIKKMSKSEKEALDREIKKIAEDPGVGEEKKGDLRGVSVHKFKLKTIQYLLAYRKVGGDLELVMIGPHENYYRDLNNI